MASAASLAPIEIKDEEIVLTIHKLRSPSYMDHMHENQACLIMEENDFQNWYFDTYNYLKNQTIPKFFDRNKKSDIEKNRSKICDHWGSIIYEVL